PIAMRLINGTGRGLKQFFKNFGEYAKEGVYKWLFGDLPINWDLIPKQWDNWSGWFEFFADLVGLSWDKILQAAQRDFSPEIDLVVSLYEKVADLADMGFDGLLEWSKQTQQEAKASLDVNAIVGKVVDGAVKAVVEIAIRQAASWAAALAPTGATQVLRA